MIRLIFSKLFAAMLATGLAAAIVAYPAQRALLAGAVGAYMLLLWLRPHLWLLVLPALLPVLDLAPWTGRLFVDELDFAVLATACVGYWRLGNGERPAELPRFFAVTLCWVGAATAIAAWIGLMPLAPLDANAFSNYLSRYNSLRVAKGFAEAMLLLPLVRHGAGPALERLERYFVPGMLLGLAAACLAVVWERATFPGLFNFSSNYRPTAPFSSMHTGGAALDAYLAISFPFVAAWLAPGKARWQTALGLLLLLLGCYAGLATFSRDMYLAYATSGGVIAALLLAQRSRGGALDLRALFGSVAVLLVAALVLARVFSTGGYRALAAALVLLVAAMVLATAPQRLARGGATWAAAVALLLADLGVFWLTDLGTDIPGTGKGAYAGFALAAGVFFVAAGALLSRRKRPAAMLPPAAVFPALALSTGLVAWHWGGMAALEDAALAIALAFALVACNRLLPQPLWRWDRPTLTLTVFWAILFATAIPLSGSYYAGERFSTTSGDMALRLRHWSEALDMMDERWQTSAFGMGLGRYPDTYFWRNGHGETPSKLSYESDGADKLFLRLVSGSYALGFGETMRELQHVELRNGARYLLSLDVRRTNPHAGLNLAICERWLIYPQECVVPALRLAAADGAWHHYALPFSAPMRGGFPRPPTQLELSNSAVGPATAIDVDNVSLQEIDTGAELIRNGAFSYGADWWFFSSDSNHLPFHAKNFAVNMFFEQGWLGAVAMAVLLLYACAHLIARAVRGETMAAIYLAALAGIMVVGLFDSLVDVPRLTLVLLLVLFGALLRPARPRKRRRKRSSSNSRKNADQAAADLIA